MLIYCYKIVNVLDDKIYVGSTRQKLSSRLSGHRVQMKKGNNTKIYQHMREIGIDKFSIIELDRREVMDRQDQLKFEREYYDKLKPELNMILPYNSHSEHLARARKIQSKWRLNHSEKVREIKSKWYKNNSEKVREMQSKWYKAIKKSGRYSCESCDMEFGDKYHLNRHLKCELHKKKDFNYEFIRLASIII